MTTDEAVAELIETGWDMTNIGTIGEVAWGMAQALPSMDDGGDTGFPIAVDNAVDKAVKALMELRLACREAQ